MAPVEQICHGDICMKGGFFEKTVKEIVCIREEVFILLKIK